MSEKFYKEEKEEHLEISIDDLANNFDYDATIVESSEIYIIREKRTRRISGVRGCSDKKEQQKIAKECLTDFLKDIIYEHRQLKYIDSKIEKITATWRNRTSWDNKRSCSGSVEATCIARFRKY